MRTTDENGVWLGEGAEDRQDAATKAVQEQHGVHGLGHVGGGAAASELRDLPANDAVDGHGGECAELLVQGSGHLDPGAIAAACEGGGLVEVLGGFVL